MTITPISRSDFEVAIVCALPLEYDAVSLLIDKFWDESGDRYGRAVGDDNRYTTGRMGNMDVVVVLLSNMGKASAAGAAASLRASYPGVRLALLTGICGGVPKTAKDEEVLLGDVIISKVVIQHDLGRQYADGFATKDTVEDGLGRPTRNIRNMVTYLETILGRRRLEERANTFLQTIQKKPQGRRRGPNYAYPGADHDRLFQASYQHKHHTSTTCECAHHQGGADSVCEASRSLLCEDLGCNDAYLVRRDRVEEKRNLQSKDRQQAQAPWIFVGRIGSGDMVVKSGENRDRLAARHKIVGFEMEGAGVWDEVPCIVVKGVCDYADSHKNKRWQDFAAATAASTAKALLEQYTKTDAPASVIARGIEPGDDRELRHGGPCFSVPFPKNKHFVGRTTILETLIEKLFTDEACLCVALVGLGGIGKTQVALQVAYWAKENQPDCSVFWVPALSEASFEQACMDIARKLGLQGAQDESPMQMVQQYLNSEEAGPWLLVVDNADDREVLFGPSDARGGMYEYLPEGENGRILFTTRSKDVADLVADDEVVELKEMSGDEAKDCLGKILARKDLLRDDARVNELLRELTYLPLAITQAAAYLKRNGVSITKYLQLLRSTEQDMVGLLSRQFPDKTRYAGSQNAIASTWLVSFEQIRKTDSAAADILSFVSQIEPKAIPQSILPKTGTEEELITAIGTLCTYAFLSRREDGETLDMHSLVQLATRIWLEREGTAESTLDEVAVHLAGVFPSDDWENREVWRQYLPHAIRVLRVGRANDGKEVCDLGYWVGRCLKVDGRIREAVEFLEYVVAVRGRTLAEEHPDRLASQHALAGAYEANGQVEKAVDLLEHVVAVKTRTLAEEHPSRLASQHELAGAYRANGQVEKAVEILEYVVAVEARTLAEEHPLRLASQHELAGAYRANGQVGKAVEILEYVVAVEARILVEEHPNRLASQHELAVAYQANGQVEKAVNLLEYIVAVKARILVEEHPDRLASQHELAVAYRANGQVEKAVEILDLQ
ncbi:hypothetical protein BGZ61DRAFT_541507 [Ilyonectria robusta]|uniref:uncharacterized protein n=1 Tax=Ilyonectria robusta TaxID=1079257 RepID=UPI001E8D386C|nr:uncharacterized protein BGZ61DRAFT_541507 [Ilyonectria robusta]KAH8654234.1 hypothetical protein BGZ61DRAFT_541507 [Ilyonectria robusta]